MGMENDAKDFLITIMQTASLLLLWMMLNVILGIYFKLGLFDQSPSLKNYIYYSLFAVSLFFLIKHFIKKWKKVKHF